MNKHLIALAAAAILAGCGGGADEQQTTAATPAAAMAQVRTALAAAPKVGAAVSANDAAEQLMNFAETSIYASFFPGHPETQSFAPFRYRAYSNGVLLGVVVTAGMGYTLDGVYVMGGPFGDSPQYVGQLTSFITPTEPGTGGPNNGCYDLGLLETTGTHIEVSMLHSGDTTGTQNLDWVVNGSKAFEGQSAIEAVIKTTGTLTVEGQSSALDLEAKSYSKRTGDAEVTEYGGETTTKASVGGFQMTTVAKSVYNPPAVDKHYGLAVGQSLTQTSTATTTSTTTGLPGVPSTPTTTTDTTTETITFVARESLTVQGKTYNTCKFTTTFAGVPNVSNTMWVIDGKGIPVKMTTTDGATITSTQEATSVKLNGQAL